MTVQCYACDRLTLKGAPLAMHGFGDCQLGPLGASVSAVYPRECANYQPAPRETTEKRVEWLERIGMRVNH